MWSDVKKYHTASLIFSFLAIAAAFYFYGFVGGALAVVTLGLIEICLSFDNAIVNMTVLKNWDDKWQKLFLWVGLPIAVFGMRFVFPIVIVAVAANMSIADTFTLAVNDGTKYGEILHSVHQEIAAFGGTFLLAVGAHFFINKEKEDNLFAVEKYMQVLKSPVAITGLSIATFGALQLAGIISLNVFLAALIGFATYYTIHYLSDKLSDGLGDGVVKQGIVGLLYLEVLDASFSLDGVIAAFAVSNNIFIIAMGLGIGAMFVRSFTIQLLKNPNVAEMKYLEHGAFWAIIALVAVMYSSMFMHVNEIIAAVTGIGFISYGIYKSIQFKKLNPE